MTIDQEVSEMRHFRLRKEGQVGIDGFVGHSAGQSHHAQVVRTCGVEDHCKII